MEVVSINGQLWEKRRAVEYDLVRKRGEFAAISSIFGSLSSRLQEFPRGIDIVAEYGLIQKKQSKLPRSQRDAVIRWFEYEYELTSIQEIKRRRAQEEAVVVTLENKVQKHGVIIFKRRGQIG